MPVQGDLGTFFEMIPEPLRWVAALGVGLGGGYTILQRYVAAKNAPPTETRATIESAAIIESGQQRLTNELLSDIRVEMRAVRGTLEAIDRRQADQIQAREAFEKAEFTSRLKLLEATRGRVEARSPE